MRALMMSVHERYRQRQHLERELGRCSLILHIIIIILYLLLLPCQQSFFSLYSPAPTRPILSPPSFSSGFVSLSNQLTNTIENEVGAERTDKTFANGELIALTIRRVGEWTIDAVFLTFGFMLSRYEDILLKSIKH